MSSEKPQQLQMLWPEQRLDQPPPVELHEGYVLRTFQDGDEEGYLNLMHTAGFDTFNQEQLVNAMKKVIPGGFFVVVHEPTNEIVATTMATHNPSDLHPYGGELGWVAASPKHPRKGLGTATCAAVTARYIEAGYRRIYLKTDDWRLPAIKVYLKQGWVPLLYAPDMEARWRDVCEALKWSFTPEDWPRAPFEAEVKKTESSEDERQDDDRPDRYAPRLKWLPHRAHKSYSSAGDVDAFGDESIYKPSGLGTACAEPSSIQAGGCSNLKLTYTAGAAGLPEGAGVKFVMRGQNPLGEELRRDAPQIEGPEACSFKSNLLGFVLEKGTLSEGERVTLEYPPFNWTPLADRKELKVVLKPGENQPEQRLPEPVVIEITPGPFARLEAVLPCTRNDSEPIPIQVTARDEFDNRVGHDGEVEIRFPSGVRHVPMVGGMAKGLVEPGGDGSVRATASLQSAEQSCLSNPCVKEDDLQLYVGDLHCHDYMSEAEGYPDEVYRWAREERKLDFVSISPQAHGWLDNETWTVTRYMTERYLKEGEFVTLLGFEWQHTGYGDKVVHYLGGDQPYLPVDDARYRSAKGLYAALRDSDALVISHHPCYPAGSWCSSTDFEAIETDVERLVELWSMHGSSEGYDSEDRPLVTHDPERQVMAALRNGVRLGFVAGSDSHSGRPGGSAKEPRPYWGGMAAVWAKDLTRRSIFEALRARRTYALTKARIVLGMTVNGAMMGSEIPAADVAGINVRVSATGEIAKVEVLKNTKLLKTYGPFGDECRVELEDKTEGPAFYHCRVTQKDGELAVCSPVWVG